MARVGVGGVAVEEAHDVSVGRVQRAPHRVALAERGPVLGQQLVLLKHLARRSARRDGLGAVGGCRVDHDDVVDQPRLGQRADRVAQHAADRRRRTAWWG